MPADTPALLEYSSSPRRNQSAAARAAALAEVVAVFALVHVTYRAFKHFTPMGRVEAASGLNYSPGAAMVLATVLLIVLRGRRLRNYGLTVRDWRQWVILGVFWGVVPVLAGAVAFKAGLVRLEDRRAPSAKASALVCAVDLLFTVLMLWMLRRRGGSPPRWRSRGLAATAAAGGLLLLLLLALPVLAAAYARRPIGPAVASVAWHFVGAGFGEEIFFRGYVQTRVDEAFGRRLRVLGARVGVGLLVSSVLFGFIHTLNTVDYFAGRFTFSWGWGVANCVTGLFFGCMRARTGSVLPGAIAHGLGDALQLIPTYL
jgi:membrane protease YdiL (CAAX protease family)